MHVPEEGSLNCASGLTVRGQPWLVCQPRLYQRLLDLKPGARNALQFCVGTRAEMTEGDAYEIIETYATLAGDAMFWPWIDRGAVGAIG